MGRSTVGVGLFVAHEPPGQSAVNSAPRASAGLYACVAHVTDIGLRRTSNQDAFLILPLDAQNTPLDTLPIFVALDEGRLLLAVADGMGGHYGGEVASRMCVESLAREAEARLRASGNDFPLALRVAIESAHQAIFAHSQAAADRPTMGTTVTAALLHGARADFAQVGDSRAYLFRDGDLILLTEDQTVGNQLRLRGADTSLVSPRIQEMLLQAVGAQAAIQVSMTALDLQPQDFLLVCCDGLHKAVPPEEIAEVLQLEAGVFEKAARLVMRANEHGGADNITVILTEIFPAETATSAPGS